MMVMNNFTTRKVDVNGFSVIYFTDDQGRDWYESQKLFMKDTMKIMFDKDGAVVSYSKDVSMLAPELMSVFELQESDLPDGFFSPSQKWEFDGVKIIPASNYASELENRDDVKRKLIESASRVITPLQDAFDFGIATENEIEKLREWKLYRINLFRLDVSSAFMEWPESPCV